MKFDRDMIVQVLTLGAVVLGGGGNAVLTEKASHERQVDIDKAVQEIHHLHDEVINEAMARQKRLEDMLSKLSKPTQ